MKSLAGTSLSGIALLFAGCSSRGPDFPIGLYDVPSSHFRQVSAAGFNRVVGPVSTEILNAARASGLKVIASTPSEGSVTTERWEAHPALWGWYLFDEPDLHLVSPKTVARLNQESHRRSKKPTLVVLTSGMAVEKYRKTADVLGVDWYPVPWAPVATVTREMRQARLANRGKPFYAVLQAFDWSSSPELLHTDTPLRPPTAEEVRCMAYLTLMQGAAGLFFYSYDSARWKLYEHTDLWHALSALAKEVRLNAPIFRRRVEWWPVRTEFHGEPSGMYNEIKEAKVLLTLHQVRRASGKIQPGYYVVAANTSASPADFSFELPFQDLTEFATSCQSDAFQVEGTSIRKTYAPFEVCIFGPIQASLTE